MRGKDISKDTPMFEHTFGETCFIAVGDGGNEFGMGELSEQFFQDKPFERPSSEANFLLPAVTSNYGCYGLVRALELNTGKSLLPNAENHSDFIMKLVDYGCVDGISAKSVPLVDGLPLSETQRILDELKSLS